MANDRDLNTDRTNDFNDLLDATVYDRDGDKVGSVGNLYTDDDSGRPSWVSVNTGLFGMNETFVPLREARISGDEIHVPYEKSYIKDAPNVAADEHLDEPEERRLYEYYGGTGQAVAGDVTDRDVADRDRVADGDRDRDRDLDRDGSVVRHEERLKVGTQERETGRVRLRKHVVTERENVEVPVRREEVRVERTPITDADTVDRDVKLGEEEHEVVLHEERPVVEKETVPVEKVSVDKQTVQETQNVQADVAKEQIEVDEDGTGRDGRRTDRR